MKQQLIQLFEQIFNQKPQVYAQAPGRINLIGGHTDYNEGYTLPVAIDEYLYVLAANNTTSQAHSLDFNETVQLNNIIQNKWSAYVQGTILQLPQIQPCNILIKGEIPIAAGLSSSAALEVATALALLKLNNISLTNDTIAKLCQKAENEFVNVNCGIMDQYTIINSKKDHAMLLDCRTLQYTHIPLPNVKIVVCNTTIKRELAKSEYNTRRTQCAQAVTTLKQFLPNIETLRDVTSQQLQQYQSHLPRTIRKRAEHVIEENARTLQAAQALKNNELNTFGLLMKQSHNSLQRKYDVSCTELDALIDIVVEQEYTIGARMTGAGFGGCTVNIIKPQFVKQFIDNTYALYLEEFNTKLDIYVTDTSNAAFAERI